MARMKRAAVTFKTQFALAVLMLAVTVACGLWALAADGATEWLAVLAYMVGAGAFWVIAKDLWDKRQGSMSP